MKQSIETLLLNALDKKLFQANWELWAVTMASVAQQDALQEDNQRKEANNA